MSEQHEIEKVKSLASAQIRVRVNQLRASRIAMLGLPELIGLVFSAVILVLVIASYFYFLTPARTTLKALKDENVKLSERITAARKGVDLTASPQATVEQINSSLERFERESLLQRSEGRLDLYTKLNEMIQRNKLRNTAGPVYAALDPLGGPGAPATAARSGNARWQSLYPGISISVTIEGQYSNLRHFLNEVESGKHFIVINGVELESVNDPNSQSGATLVSLRLEMATYFQRTGQTGDTNLDIRQ